MEIRLLLSNIQLSPVIADQDAIHFDYSAAVLVLDTRDPRRVVYRSPDPLLAPETPDDIEGPGPSAVFPTGVDDREHGRLDVYYGMTDTRIGAACLQVPTHLPGATPS